MSAERPTACYCAATHAPCAWCTDHAWPCPSCGAIVDRDERCCGLWVFDGTPVQEIPVFTGEGW